RCGESRSGSRPRTAERPRSAEMNSSVGRRWRSTQTPARFSASTSTT
ncbi:uncharacterized protein METZ01_LOCUS276084, partial [marine metagenome]